MPETQQRSKEAVGALQAALKCPDMGTDMAKEVNRVCCSFPPVFLFLSFACAQVPRMGADMAKEVSRMCCFFPLFVLAPYCARWRHHAD
jgi:hypothetical protein